MNNKATISALRTSAAPLAFALALAATPAAAQDSPPAGNVVPLEAVTAEDTGDVIIVTGSRIRRPDIENSTPTVVIGQAAFENRGIENFADLATQLPQFSPSFGSSRTQSTFSGAADSGLNTVNLRNLGGGRTLTLQNGRRLAGGTTTTTAVDFNMLPTANIGQVEVITGGASAIYGADAVAGVVNIITDKSLEGFEVGGSWSISEHGDNKNPNAYLRFGSSFGNGGYIQATGQFDYQGRVSCADRYLCAEDFAWFPPDDPMRGPSAYSAVGVNGTFFLDEVRDGDDNVLFPGIQATRIGDSFTDAEGNLIPFVVERDGFNRNGVRTLAIPTKRYMAAIEAEYPISDIAQVFFEFNYGRSETNADFEGHPFQSSQPGSLFGGGPGIDGLAALIPIDNPFVPDAIREAALERGQTTIDWQQRFSALDERGASNTREMTRFVAGVRGDFQIGNRDWNYEAFYLNGRTELDSLTRGLVSTRNLYYGLRVEEDPDNPGEFRCEDEGARASGCVPINPFAPYTQEMRNALNVDAGQHGVSQLHNAVAYASGEVFELPGGPLSVAFGAEWRKFSGYLDYDEPINNATVTGNQIGDVDKASIVTKEVFIEGVAPILTDTFVTSLTLEGAFRYSKPNGADSYNTWRYGGTLEPIDGLRLRVMRGRAVRAPVPDELSGVGQTFGTVNDPCSVDLRNDNPTRAANCAADGVPATYDPPLNVRQSVGGFVGGNPDLSPERATTLTYGLAFTPDFVPGLTLTIDRFEIDLEDVISTVGRQNKANACYDTADRLFCEDIERGTNPNVPGANYVLTSVNDQLINIASYDIKGIDFSARYSRPLANGNAYIDATATHYDRARQVPTPLSEEVDLLGFAGGSTSDQGWVKWTGNGNIGWESYGGFSFNWNVRYIGKAKTAEFVPTPPYPVIGDRFYHNLRLALTLEDRYTIYGGVDNLFDSDPPLFPTSTAGTQALDTIPAYYDVFGRSYYIGTKLRF